MSAPGAPRHHGCAGDVAIREDYSQPGQDSIWSVSVERVQPFGCAAFSSISMSWRIAADLAQRKLRGTSSFMFLGDYQPRSKLKPFFTLQAYPPRRSYQSVR